MAAITPQMGLQKWDLVTDNFSHAQFAANLDILDIHDHTQDKGVQIPAGGIADLSISTAKVQDGAITAAKLGASAVGSASIATNAVIAAKIADGNVTRAKLSTATIQTARVSTGAIVGAGGAAITITFAQAFADTNYTATCSMVEATNTASTLYVHHIVSKAAGSLVVRVKNDDGAVTKTGTVSVIAIHD